MLNTPQENFNSFSKPRISSLPTAVKLACKRNRLCSQGWGKEAAGRRERNGLRVVPHFPSAPLLSASFFSVIPAGGRSQAITLAAVNWAVTQVNS